MAYGGCPSLYSDNSELSDELTILQEIFLDDISIKDSNEGICHIQLQIQPATGEHVDRKLVSVMLEVTLFKDYPYSLPRFVLCSPKGLSDEHLDELQSSLNSLAMNHVGCPMIYDLIEHIRESLTNNNVPSTQCMICLDAFCSSSSDIMKTSCYHYFHQGCFFRYYHFIKREQDISESEGNFEVCCPVCRSIIDDDFKDKAATLPKYEDDVNFKYKPTKEILQIRQDMQVIFFKQKQQGGIIDLEEERNKFLITTQPVDKNT